MTVFFGVTEFYWFIGLRLPSCGRNITLWQFQGVEPYTIYIEKVAFFKLQFYGNPPTIINNY